MTQEEGKSCDNIRPDIASGAAPAVLDTAQVRYALTPWQILLVVALAAVIIAIRKPDTIIHPQFWAEDGKVYFLDDYSEGIWAIFKPYAGYLVLIPRLLAFIWGALLPYAAIPFAYNYASYALKLLVVGAICCRRFEVPHKPLLALAVVLTPNPSNEVFLNITNIQWPLALLILVTALKSEPDRKFGRVWAQILTDFLILLLCGLTGPYIIITLPLFLWRLVRNKTKYSAFLLGAVVLISFIQAAVILGSPSPAGDSAPLTMEDIAAVIGIKLFAIPFLGRWSYDISPWLSCALLFALLAALLNLSRRGQPGYLLATASIIYMLSMMLATFFRKDLKGLVPPLNGTRYFYLQNVALFWAMIACLNVKRPVWNAVIGCMLALAILSFARTSVLSTGFRWEENWSAYSKRIGKGETIRVKLNPTGWYMDVPPWRHGKVPSGLSVSGKG